MNRARYTKLMTGLAFQVSRVAMESADMAEIDDPLKEVEIKSVIKECDLIRERILWIERAALSIN